MPATFAQPEYQRAFEYALCDTEPPLVERVEGYDHWWVARDDLKFVGGTKSRFLFPLLHALGWRRGMGVCYAGPAQGGMQLALATTALSDAHLFYGERPKKGLHPRQQQTLHYGAVHHYSPYPSVRPAQVKSLCRKWAQTNDALNIRWSLSYPEVISAIGFTYEALVQKHGRFDEIWVAGGGGTLARGLYRGGHGETPVHVVPIGRRMKKDEAPGCTIHVPPAYPMDKQVTFPPPFPCDPYYDAKAWEAAIEWQGPRRNVRRLFWNVIAPPNPYPPTLSKGPGSYVSTPVGTGVSSR
jgi:hypothetical protein